jgi:hypothetical protein
MELWCGENSYISPGKDSWYNKLNYLLHHGNFLENLNLRERRALGLKYAQYCLVNSVLFQLNYDGVLLICLECEYTDKVPKELHDGPICGNFTGDTTSHKILRVVYYWPTLFKYTHTCARNYKTCQLSVGREKRVVIPLQLVIVSRHFEQWGLDIIG